MRMESEIAKLMQENGYRLVRKKNHSVWKNDNGNIIILFKNFS